MKYSYLHLLTASSLCVYIVRFAPTDSYEIFRLLSLNTFCINEVIWTHYHRSKRQFTNWILLGEDREVGQSFISRSCGRRGTERGGTGMAFRIWRAKWDRGRLRGLALPELTQRACNSELRQPWRKTGTAWIETNCPQTDTTDCSQTCCLYGAEMCSLKACRAGLTLQSATTSKMIQII